MHCDGPSALEYFKVLCSQYSAKILLSVIKDLSLLEEVEILDKTAIGLLLRKGLNGGSGPNT